MNTEKLASIFLTLEDENVCREERIIVAENMIKWGGSFVRGLGTALLKANVKNTQRIKKAFPDYWAKYKAL